MPILRETGQPLIGLKAEILRGQSANRCGRILPPQEEER
jgi:hypothetical protein